MWHACWPERSGACGRCALCIAQQQRAVPRDGGAAGGGSGAPGHAAALALHLHGARGREGALRCWPSRAPSACSRASRAPALLAPNEAPACLVVFMNAHDTRMQRS